ncbi:MAG: hypothetical protein A2Y24_08955 [Clostridiales bacterium GWE2_32_10]|nr:MAG: hypothetical protein A2Y24_08955 [Clostridiales bacterium GWE2_32_10]HBY20108.1 DNA replication protein DnaC [Clostridiales bacterium]
MSVPQNIYKQIIAKFDKKRFNAEHTLDLQKNEIYSILPRVKQIDSLLFNTGLRLSRAIIEDPTSTNKLLSKIQTETHALESEKVQLLIENGYPKDYLQIKYSCKKCNDTGFINNKPCTCFEQELMLAAYASSNIKEILSEENFDNFNFEYYSDEKYPTQKLTPQENIKRIYQIAHDFAHNFDKQFTNLLFYGSPGTGKTYLCNCIAKDLLDAGKGVLYLTAFELFKLIEDDRFNKKDDETEERTNFLDSIFKADLLIIDDLGTEFHTTLSNASFFNCINTRLLHKKTTVISTNFTLENLQKTYSARIVSRVLGNYKTLEFYGRDIRQIKKRVKYT